MSFYRNPVLDLKPSGWSWTVAFTSLQRKQAEEKNDQGLKWCSGASSKQTTRARWNSTSFGSENFHITRLKIYDPWPSWIVQVLESLLPWTFFFLLRIFIDSRCGLSNATDSHHLECILSSSAFSGAPFARCTMLIRSAWQLHWWLWSSIKASDWCLALGGNRWVCSLWFTGEAMFDRLYWHGSHRWTLTLS